MTVKDILNYIQGNIRYQLFYNPYMVEFIRDHILEQILSRIISMDKKCYNDGECKLCGCKTTALQMCNKACDKPCYPAMVGKKEWKLIKDSDKYFDKDNNLWRVSNLAEGVKFEFIS